MNSTTIEVLTAVARFASTPATPTFARIAVAAANSADRRDQVNQVIRSRYHEEVFLLLILSPPAKVCGEAAPWGGRSCRLPLLNRADGKTGRATIATLNKLKRILEPELLDELPADDPRAIHSRRDLQRVNALMGHAGAMARALTVAFNGRSPRSIVELGAGDGTLLLQLAKQVAPRWKPSRVALVDRQQLLTPHTQAEFAALSWNVEAISMDVFDWLERPNAEPSDVTIATLFLHHFENEDLRRLLCRAASQTGVFLSCEPRRSNFALTAAGLLPLIGCNGVTWHDATISVRAGFADQELSGLWPHDDSWRLTERQQGLFSHSFMAQRIQS